jgi:hypothetical protein
MSDHDIAATMLASQLLRLQSCLTNVRAGLYGIQHTAAAQSMTDGNDNATRAAWAAVEQRVKALLEVCGG